MNAFLQSVASVLEVSSVSIDDDFRAAPGWCPSRERGLLGLLENGWQTPVARERFLALRTVRDLYREAFATFAARVFGVGREELSGSTAYGSIPAWDSVNHLKLAMEAERKFGVSYPLELIPFLKTLDDFLVA